MTASDLRRRYEAALKTLQDNCPHEETEVLEHHLTPGHFMGMGMFVNDVRKSLQQRKKDDNQAN